MIIAADLVPESAFFTSEAMTTVPTASDNFSDLELRLRRRYRDHLAHEFVSGHARQGYRPNLRFRVGVTVCIDEMR